MANTQAAKKALRVNIRRQILNQSRISKTKTIVKKAHTTVSKKSKDAASVVVIAQRALDVAAQKKIIHKRKAARLKSRLMKKLKKIKS